MPEFSRPPQDSSPTVEYLLAEIETLDDSQHQNVAALTHEHYANEEQEILAAADQETLQGNGNGFSSDAKPDPTAVEGVTDQEGYQLLADANLIALNSPAGEDHTGSTSGSVTVDGTAPTASPKTPTRVAGPSPYTMSAPSPYGASAVPHIPAKPRTEPAAPPQKLQGMDPLTAEAFERPLDEDAASDEMAPAGLPEDMDGTEDGLLAMVRYQQEKQGHLDIGAEAASNPSTDQLGAQPQPDPGAEVTSRGSTTSYQQKVRSIYPELDTWITTQSGSETSAQPTESAPTEIPVTESFADAGVAAENAVAVDAPGSVPAATKGNTDADATAENAAEDVPEPPTTNDTPIAYDDLATPVEWSKDPDEGYPVELTATHEPSSLKLKRIFSQKARSLVALEHVIEFLVGPDGVLLVQEGFGGKTSTHLREFLDSWALVAAAGMAWPVLSKAILRVIAKMESDSTSAMEITPEMASLLSLGGVEPGTDLELPESSREHLFDLNRARIHNTLAFASAVLSQTQILFICDLIRDQLQARGQHIIPWNEPGFDSTAALTELMALALSSAQKRDTTLGAGLQNLMRLGLIDDWSYHLDRVPLPGNP